MFLKNQQKEHIKELLYDNLHNWTFLTRVMSIPSLKLMTAMECDKGTCVLFMLCQQTCNTLCVYMYIPYCILLAYMGKVHTHGVLHYAPINISLEYLV